MKQWLLPTKRPRGMFVASSHQHVVEATLSKFNCKCIRWCTQLLLVGTSSCYYKYSIPWTGRRSCHPTCPWTKDQLLTQTRRHRRRGVPKSMGRRRWLGYASFSGAKSVVKRSQLFPRYFIVGVTLLCVGATKKPTVRQCSSKTSCDKRPKPCFLFFYLILSHVQSVVCQRSSCTFALESKI